MGSVLRYWRNGLADEMADDVSVLLKDGVDLPLGAVEAGLVPKPVAKAIRNKAAPVGKAEAEATGDDGAVPVMVALRVYAPERQHAYASRPDGLTIAAAVRATLLEDGRLIPADGLPFIERRNLEPTGEPLAVASLADVDRWTAANPAEPDLEWPDMMAWFARMWTEVAQGQNEFEGYVATSQLRIAPRKKDGGLSGGALIDLYDDILSGEGPQPLLESLVLGNPDIASADQSLRIRQMGAPRGTMGTAHALAASQADAVAALTAMPSGKLLAVKGPPGTGKTTLLQSVIATEVVARAIEGGHPAVIFGVSANNQAVTNIINAMNGVLAAPRNAESRPWSKRWIPGCASYGLYLPAKHRVEAAEKAGHLYAASSGRTGPEFWQGLPELESDSAFLRRAETEWTSRFTATYGAEAELQDAVEHIRRDLLRLRDRMAALTHLMTAWDASATWWRETLGADYSPEVIESEETKATAALVARQRVLFEADQDRTEASERQAAIRLGMLRALESANRAMADADAQLEAARNQYQALEAGSLPTGFLEVLAIVLPIPALQELGVRRRLLRVQSMFDDGDPRRQETSLPTLLQSMASVRDEKLRVQERAKSVAARMADSLATHDREAVSILAIRQARVDDAQAEIEEQHRRNGVWLGELRSRASRLEAETISLAAALGELAAPYGIVDWSVDVAGADMVADRGIRNEMFEKAMRYWEGRWLLECRAIAAGDVNMRAGRDGMSAMLRRWCMLTPCLIATLHSATKVMKFYSGKQVGYQHGFIDLLIMDESGQVPPHIAAPMFSLADRAVIVGDVHQLEPIVGLPARVDLSNGIKEGLGTVLWDDGEPKDPRAITPSTSGGMVGSAMVLAQRATAFTSPGQGGEPGIFLSEHRRCRTALITYCNELVYRGRLEPRRPEPPVPPPPLPVFGWAHVRGPARKSGGSRSNEKEATAIADFIAGNIDAWSRHYDSKLRETVAVITPFAAQAELLRSLLAARRRELAELTVGTVSSLQGAEAHIVVFSPASDGTEGRPFFDRQPNMLNVAVSRARDAFVVIGNMGLFRGSTKTPAGLLGRFLFEAGEEIPGIEGNHLFSADTLKTARRLSSLDEHLEALHASVRDAPAGQVVVIVSPYLSSLAVQFPPFLQLCEQALARGVRIHIVIDEWFLKKGMGHQPAVALQQLRGAGLVVTLVQGIHSKSIITPDRIIDGSFNWLSAHRHTNQWIRHETSWSVSGPGAAADIERALEELRALGLKMA